MKNAANFTVYRGEGDSSVMILTQFLCLQHRQMRRLTIESDLSRRIILKLQVSWPPKNQDCAVRANYFPLKLLSVRSKFSIALQLETPAK